ncbi:hypothetical protein KIN20_033605 [Parelaphostrongylus tenuis]|uniref:Uncharacterized protein n=1 Tax=Parelaphostrongylus tenuis TaxID=148309 RepID=A0AAD5R8Q0_PARTN|nr:hypothetical protein KIN20_033605 [Parelaphostrongylus tenuis]
MNANMKKLKKKWMYRARALPPSSPNFNATYPYIAFEGECIFRYIEIAILYFKINLERVNSGLRIRNDMIGIFERKEQE